MISVYRCNGINLVLSDDVQKVMRSLIQINNTDKEKGGILIGKIHLLSNEYTITDLSCPYETDLALPSRFIRNAAGHQEKMDNAWKISGETKTYLGEWHTHYETIPNPSNIDIKNWNNIYKRNHNSEILFFIIQGTSDISVWIRTVSGLYKMQAEM